jgi:hypothetical protein
VPSPLTSSILLTYTSFLIKFSNYWFVFFRIFIAIISEMRMSR